MLASPPWTHTLHLNTAKMNSGPGPEYDSYAKKEADYGQDLTTSSSPTQDGDIYTANNVERPGFWTRLGVTPDSFRQRTLDDKNNQLNKTLKSRHLNMIAIGGSIGAGLFVGSGGALSRGGPAALLIGFGIIGIVSSSAKRRRR